MPTLRTKVIT